MSQPPSPEQRAAQMKEAIENAQRTLDRSKDFFEESGLNGEKARAFLTSSIDDKSRAEAQRAFEQDMQDVEQEAREQLARESSPPASAPKRPRPMV